MNLSLGKSFVAFNSSNLGATEDMAKGLAVELIGAWLVSSNTGAIARPADVVAKSERITSLIGTR